MLLLNIVPLFLWPLYETSVAISLKANVKVYKGTILNISHFGRLFSRTVPTYISFLCKCFFSNSKDEKNYLAYTIDPIFKLITDSVQLYFTNGFTNIVQSLNIIYSALCW